MASWFNKVLYKKDFSLCSRSAMILLSSCVLRNNYRAVFTYSMALIVFSSFLHSSVYFLKDPSLIYLHLEAAPYFLLCLLLFHFQLFYIFLCIAEWTRTTNSILCGYNNHNVLLYLIAYEHSADIFIEVATLTP